MEQRDMDEKITIIEGPPPTFEAIGDGWAMGLNDSPSLYNIALTRLRTFNGPALLERCHRAWRHQNTINLEYRSTDGLQNQAPILAARTLDSDEGQMLFLWVRLPFDEESLEEEGDSFDGDGDDDLDDDLGFPGR
jgi:hypothetical protein